MSSVSKGTGRRGEQRRATGLEPLGTYETLFWKRDDSVPSWGRKAGEYRAFVPSTIAKRAFAFDSRTADLLAQATGALQHLQHRATTDTQKVPLGLLRTLLRSESAASSRIEGKQVSQRNLARASFAAEHNAGGDPRAAEVFGNVQAMERAIELGATASSVGLTDITDIHRTLLRFTVDKDIAGVLRDKQNWIGGNDYHPIGATYIGPPVDHVAGLVKDLCRFINRDDIPAIAQAAIVHSQFENIHPFADGNGRTGRALIYTVLKRRGLLETVIPPVSLVLGAAPKNYVAGLGSYSAGDIDRWCSDFAEVVMHATRRAEDIGQALTDLQGDFVSRLGKVRSDAAVLQIVDALPAHPVLDIASMTQLTGKTRPAVTAAIRTLVGHEVLVPVNEKKWGQVWECRELFVLMDGLEASLQAH